MSRERVLRVVLLLVGLIFVFAVYPLMMYLWPKAPAAAHIVVAAKDLPVGATLAPGDVMLLDWFSTSLPAGTFAKTDAVLGRPLLFPVVAKQPITDRGLGVSGAGIGLAGKIPAGVRAIAVRSNEISGVAGFLFPGSHVDCMVKFTPTGAEVPQTQTVLQNVEVLAAGQTIEPDPQGKPQKVNIVTVLLTPEDSRKMQLASAQGNIQCVFRIDAPPTTLDQIFASEKPPVGVNRQRLERLADPPPVKRYPGGSNSRNFGSKLDGSHLASKVTGAPARTASISRASAIMGRSSAADNTRPDFPE